MFSNVSAPTLDLRLRPSQRASSWLLGFHIAAIALTLLAQPPRFAALGIALAFIGSWFWLRQHPAFGSGPRALVHLIAQGDGSWTIEDARGERDEAELLGSTYVTIPLIVLNFRTSSGMRKARAILGDELDAEPLRRLRAKLLSLRGMESEAKAGDRQI